jgi:hypothetical protein
VNDGDSTLNDFFALLMPLVSEIHDSAALIIGQARPTYLTVMKHFGFDRG